MTVCVFVVTEARKNRGTVDVVTVTMSCSFVSREMEGGRKGQTTRPILPTKLIYSEETAFL